MSRGINLCVSWDQPLCLKPNTLSKTKTTHEVEFMFLDEFTARFKVVTHQDSKSLIRCKMSLRAFQTLCLTDSTFVSQISTFVSPTKMGDQMSSSLTSRACFSMNSRRGSRWSPIRTQKEKSRNTLLRIDVVEIKIDVSDPILPCRDWAGREKRHHQGVYCVRDH